MQESREAAPVLKFYGPMDRCSREMHCAKHLKSFSVSSNALIGRHKQKV